MSGSSPSPSNPNAEAVRAAASTILLNAGGAGRPEAGSAGSGGEGGDEVTETRSAISQTVIGITPAHAASRFPWLWMRAAATQGLHLIALLALLYFAIGATCEISSRNEDYGRVSVHQKWLVTCQKNAEGDKGCPSGDSLASQLDSASVQVRRYDSLNAIGATSRCLTAVVIAAPISAFHEDCLRLETTLGQPNKVESASLDKGVRLAAMGDVQLTQSSKFELQDPQSEILLQAILRPGWASYASGRIPFDQMAKEQVYFLLVLLSAAIGSLIAGLRTAGFTTVRDLTIGLGVGFAVYLLLRSGNFVFLATPASIDILNPFAAAAVGLLVGLFSDRVLKMLDNFIGTKLPNPVAAAPGTAQVNVMQAEKTVTTQTTSPDTHR
ncbi:hypothetical protein BH11PSE3_BH11PSE3_32590 [soil metagenome]